MDKQSSNPNVKLCLSSRPWTAFRDAYGTDASRTVRLEELTYGDIEIYVNDHFNRNARFKELATGDPEYVMLVREVVGKAQGVFLGVHLVVKLLLQGLTDSLRVSDLRQRLKSFPPDLEDFFQRILDSVDPCNRVWTSVCLELANMDEAPFDWMIYSFVGEKGAFELDETFSWLEGKQLNDDVNARLILRQNITVRRLDAFSKGLLEHQPFPSTEVNFLHRSVKEFLTSSNRKCMIGKHSPRDFDQYWFLVQTHLALIRLRWGSSMCFTEFPSLEILVKRFQSYASTLETRSKSAPKNLCVALDHFEGTLPALIENNKLSECLLGYVPEHQDATTFLHFCIHSQFYYYATQRVNNGAHTYEQIIDLLNFLLYQSTNMVRSRSDLAPFFESSPVLVEALLKAVSGPNQRFSSSNGVSSAWIRFIFQLDLLISDLRRYNHLGLYGDRTMRNEWQQKMSVMITHRSLVEGILGESLESALSQVSPSRIRAAFGETNDVERGFVQASAFAPQKRNASGTQNKDPVHSDARNDDPGRNKRLCVRDDRVYHQC